MLEHACVPRQQGQQATGLLQSISVEQATSKTCQRAEITNSGLLKPNWKEKPESCLLFVSQYLSCQLLPCQFSVYSSPLPLQVIHS